MAGDGRTIEAESLDSDVLLPEAWLPDGSLILMAKSYAEDPMTEGIVHRLGVLNAENGLFEEFASATYVISSPGFAVAVSPDGTQVAYQYESRVTIYNRLAEAKTVFDLPPQSVLAGKGAWSPGGSRIVIASINPQRDREWSLTFLDPVTGLEAADSESLSLRGAALIRLIGWNSQTQKPIVVAYDAPHAPTWDLVREISTTVTPEQISRVSIYELNYQGVGPTAIMQMLGDVDGVDVASVAIDSGNFRAGGPPHQVTPIGSALLGLLVLIVSIIGIVWARWGTA
ncbi:hypothetical protein [Micromonospora sp. LOL_023]|uniref:hypothetical protein n=1 Tax=Micromonospora sp. LOL_023 TaxID=3345418 RepID=UPI003A870577